MFSTSDTIVAIATPPGRGAIGVVRISGPAASAIGSSLIARTAPLEPRRATFTTLSTHTVALADRVVVTFFPNPHSYTGDDVVEISTHGSAVILHAVVEAAITGGARLAAPGEFTLRAFVNGKVDLPQAEAVADLVDAVTPLQARAAFDQLNGTLTSALAAIEAKLFDVIARLEASVDFPEEGYHFIEPREVDRRLREVADDIEGLLATGRRGKLVREGIQVVIAGSPNVGKSSLFNALVGSHRAIVSDRPGTTRDLVAEVVDLNGLRVTLIDTAGVAESSDAIEREGMSRARRAMSVADVVLLVCDSERTWSESRELFDAAGARAIVVASKADVSAWRRPDAVVVSSAAGSGLNDLVVKIQSLVVGEPVHDTPAISNVRHIALLEGARDMLHDARRALEERDGSLPEEFLLADLQRTRSMFEEISGRRTPDDVLIHIFERFCVGK